MLKGWKWSFRRASWSGHPNELRRERNWGEKGPQLGCWMMCSLDIWICRTRMTAWEWFEMLFIMFSQLGWCEIAENYPSQTSHQFSLLAFILSAAFDPTTKATDMNGWKLLNWISIKQNSKVSRVNAGNRSCVWSCSYSFPYVSQTLGPPWFGSTGWSRSNWLGTADGAELATASGETWREKKHAVFVFCSGENGGKIMGTWWNIDWKKWSMEICENPMARLEYYSRG